jgi:putative flavoprotein involved in K+ transport
MGFFDVRREHVEDPSELRAAQPQISGVGRYGHTVSLQQLEKAGAHLLGRLREIRGGVLFADDDLADNIAFADERSGFAKNAIDTYIRQSGMELPPLDPDPADEPAGADAGRNAPTELDLRETDVGALIWCTGFTADFSWIDIPVLDENGMPLHDEGISPQPGLFFLGFPWMRNRKSGIICGMAEDSAFIVSEVERHLDGAQV